MLNVTSIDNGVVIDHIKCGMSSEIYKLLGLRKKVQKQNCSVATLEGVKSERMGKKDIIKIDGLVDLDLDILGFIDKDLTVNIIRGGVITEKKQLTMPKSLVNVILCKNPRCVTSSERDINQEFILTENNNNPVYRCAYCEQKYTR